MICFVLYSVMSSLSNNFVYGEQEVAIPIVYSEKNKTVILTCQITALDGNVQWYRLNPEETYSQGQIINTMLPQHRRLRVVGNFDKGEFNLQISHVRRLDTGKYSCSTKTNQSIITKEVYLQITANKSGQTTEDNIQLKSSFLYLTTASAYSPDKRTKENKHLTNLYYGLLGVGVLAVLSLLVIIGDLVYRHCNGRSRQIYHPRIQNSTLNVNSIYDYVNEEEMAEQDNTANNDMNTSVDVVTKETPPLTSNQNSLLNDIREEIYETPYNGILSDHLDNCQYDEIM